MSSRGLAVLGAVTLIAVIGAGILLWSDSQTYAGFQGSTDRMFTALADPEAQVTDLDIETPNYRLQMRQSDDGWIASSHADYPVRASVATALIADIAALRPLAAKTRNPEWYGFVGVEDRAAEGARSSLVEIRNGDEILAEVLVGKVSTSLGADPIGGTFVRVPGDAQTWLGSGVVEVSPTQDGWFENLFNIPAPELQRIAISEGGILAFDARRAEGEARYTLVASGPAHAEDGTMIEDLLLRRLAQTLISTSFEAVRKAGEVSFPANMRTVRFETAAGLVLEARIAEAENSPWVVFDVEAAGDEATELAADIRQRTQGWAFRLSNERMLALMTSIADLLTMQAEAKPEDGAGEIITDQTFFNLSGAAN